MKKKLGAIVSAAILIAGCAGSTPHPVPQHQPGDEDMTCEQIKLEISDNQTKIMNLIPKTNKTGKNVGLGVAGAFLLVPWFFMDFSDAERIEIEAYQLRDHWLRILANKKRCGTLPPEIKFQGK